MKAWAKKAKKAAVVGGGLLGLEAAKALTDLNLDTTVIEYSPRLMPRQIDQAGSDVLVKKLSELGVKVLTQKQTRSILGNEKVEGIEFADGEILKLQMVVISAGIRPRDELALACGLPCAERGGIVADEYLQTADPAIYAIGECAAVGGTVFGLAAPGYRMAEIAAHRILGLEVKPFAGADMSTKLKLMGVDVASIGNSGMEAGGAEDAALALQEGQVSTEDDVVGDERLRVDGGDTAPAEDPYDSTEMQYDMLSDLSSEADDSDWEFVNTN